MTFISKTHIMTLTPSKAKYGLKKDYATIVKNGFMLFDFIPFGISEVNSLPLTLWKEKESFLLDPRKSLEITIPDFKAGEEFNNLYAYKNLQREIEFITFTEEQRNEPENKNKIMSIRYHNKEADIKYQTLLSQVDVIIMQKLINFSFPYLMGWHALDSSKAAEEDLFNEQVSSDFSNKEKMNDF